MTGENAATRGASVSPCLAHVAFVDPGSDDDDDSVDE